MQLIITCLDMMPLYQLLCHKFIPFSQGKPVLLNSTTGEAAREDIQETGFPVLLELNVVLSGLQLHAGNSWHEPHLPVLLKESVIWTSISPSLLI